MRECSPCLRLCKPTAVTGRQPQQQNQQHKVMGSSQTIQGAQECKVFSVPAIRVVWESTAGSKLLLRRHPYVTQCSSAKARTASDACLTQGSMKGCAFAALQSALADAVILSLLQLFWQCCSIHCSCLRTASALFKILLGMLCSYFVCSVRGVIKISCFMMCDCSSALL